MLVTELRNRAQIANNAKADITIRIHCDSINDGGKTGTVILVPAKDGKYTNGIFEDSNRYAQILKNKLQESNIKVNGIFERSDITELVEDIICFVKADV